ncbi:MULTISPECIES: FeoB-associated Cys-rich membrane protein [unclassified Listeria]|uniref:FeoB-associated Cys-rich membrane protein n=1 Tax=unclassified Listeria TaxID=2642072 RepID=UPI000B588642|nr:MULTISPECIES: FeoB-associated Cys-rich membrane protein [unclassified Listeria]
MAIFVNLLLGGLIFGYTIFALVRFTKKSRQGKCAACELKKTCESENELPTHLK